MFETFVEHRGEIFRLRGEDKLVGVQSQSSESSRQGIHGNLQNFEMFQVFEGRINAGYLVVVDLQYERGDGG